MRLPLALIAVLVAGAATAALALAQTNPARWQVRPPLIGANYAHTGNVGCTIDGTGILARYHLPDVRDRVRGELATMRRRGLETLRLIVWHMKEPPEESYGIVPSTGGQLPEPYRASLAQYAADVRDAGFEQLEISFAPRVWNHPGSRAYDPTLFEENWGFIQDVRAIVKANGPPSIHFDLMNEGSPGDDVDPALDVQRTLYLMRLWRLYGETFGVDDAVISITAGRFPADRPKLERLLAIFEASGVGYPRWFEVHAGYEARRALNGLRIVDEVLTAHGLTQPIVIGEAPYDAPGVAQAIGTYIDTTARPTLEVIQWPLTSDRPCPAVSVSAPFAADAYRRALLGPPRLDLRLTEARGVSLLRAGQEGVGRPAPGLYTVAAIDRSGRRGLWLRGPGVSRSTKVRFRGTRIWTVDLRPGARYRFGAGRGAGTAFTTAPAAPPISASGP